MAMSIGFDGLGMKKIEPTHIERGGNRNLGPTGHQAFGEVHAAVAVIERAVDMGGGDMHHALGAQQAAHLGGDPHGHRRCLAAFASRERALLVRQDHRHGFNLPCRPARIPGSLSGAPAALKTKSRSPRA